MTDGDLADVIAASSLGVVAWSAGGAPRARGVVALVRGDRPALAFTYADAAVAREIGSTTHAVLALTERRSTGSAFRPTLLRGRPRLVEDPSGDLFVDDLLLQELRKYPPSRLFADSPLLMREHWWYLPRLVVELDVDHADPVEGVEGEDHLLVVAAGADVAVRPARAGERHGDHLEVPAAGEVSPGPAVLFGQDATFPDLEQWAQWRYRGCWDGTLLQVEESPGRVGLGPPPGLIRRWRRQRALQRACVAAIPPP